jgi:hypothetical protein
MSMREKDSIRALPTHMPVTRLLIIARCACTTRGAAYVARAVAGMAAGGLRQKLPGAYLFALAADMQPLKGVHF